MLPILEYDHSLGCSVTGGYRYRGARFPDLYGHYLFGDFCSGRIWTATDATGTWTATQALDTSLLISTFGEDEVGELYVADRQGTNGAIYRIVLPGGGTTKDLVIQALGLSAASVPAGSTVTVSYDVVNLGTATVTESYRERIFLSTDSTLGGDQGLARSHVHVAHSSQLPPNGHHASSTTVRIPANTVPGTYQMLVQADTYDAVVESNEGNNVAAIQITVTP